jgi:hypothetical protein
MKGIVYKITSNNKIYIGSTERTMEQRLNSGHHRVFTKYGFDKYNYTIEILEEIHYNDKLELFKLEGEYVIKYDCVNKSLPCGLGKDKKTYDKIRYENNKVMWRQYSVHNRERINIKRSERRKRKLSWGGDPRNSNNLLKIYPFLFLE